LGVRFGRSWLRALNQPAVGEISAFFAILSGLAVKILASAVHNFHLVVGARPGAERFTAPGEPNQRRYEALRAYYVEGVSAAEVAERFGYTRASVETLVRDWRAGRLELFASSRPGPRAQPKKDRARALVVALRSEGRSLQEIGRALEAAGAGLSRTAIWEILAEAGMGRLPAGEEQTAATATPAAPKTRRLRDEDWPQAGTIRSEHAGLFLLVPELVELELPGLVAAAGYPGTSQLGAVNSLLSLLALKLYERRRRSHVADVVHDHALGVFCGLTVLPKRTHLTGYSYRTTRAHNQALLGALVERQRAVGLVSGESFNLDFHAIMSFGEDEILDEHYVPRRSQRTRSVLTFFAQDGEHATLCYANADIAKAQQAHEIARFCEFWQRRTGQPPGLLIFDSQLTTHAELAALDEQGIGFITLRRRGKSLMEQVAALPDDAWQPVRLQRPGKRRDVSVAEIEATIERRSFRQLAVRGLGRDQPTLLLTNQRDRTAKQLIERYARRWSIENALAAQIRAFHLDALSSQVPLAVDLDTTLSVLCDSVYRSFARRLENGYATATPDTIFRHFIAAPGDLRVSDDGVEVRLRPRAHTPVLLDTGYRERATDVPWWNGRRLTFSFPPA
jgi:transposase